MHPSNVRCPACGAYPGEPCQSLSTLPGALAPLKGFHAEREDRAKERTFPEHVRSVTFPRHVNADGSGVYEAGKSPEELRLSQPPPSDDPLSVLCPLCCARPGEPCHNLEGITPRSLEAPHTERACAVGKSREEQYTALVWGSDELRSELQQAQERITGLRAMFSREEARRKEAEAALQRVKLNTAEELRAHFDAKLSKVSAELAGVGPCPACAEGLVAIGKPCRACGYSL